MKQTDFPTGLEFWASAAPAPGNGSIVTVFGELDTATAPRLRDVFAEALEGDGDVELDMRGCGFVDSSGIATLIWAALRLKERGRTLRIQGVRHRVRKILDLAGVAGHSAIVLGPPTPED